MQSGEAHMEMKALHRLGWSITAIAGEYNLSRTTVYKELTSPGPRSYGPRARLFTLNEAERAHIERRLVVCPGIRGTDLHTELRADYGYQGQLPHVSAPTRVASDLGRPPARRSALRPGPACRPKPTGHTSDCGNWAMRWCSSTRWWQSSA